MLGTFLDKMSGFFDQRFILAYVIPTLIFLGLLIGLTQVWFGLPITLKWWTNLAVLEQILIGIIALLAIILVAYILQMLTAPIVRLYEGYWPEWKRTQAAISSQRRRWERYARIDKREELTNKLRELAEKQNMLIDDDQIASIEEQIAHELKQANAASYYTFPHNPDLLKPTRLGNVLVAVEEYPYQIYQLDAAIWWPRLAVLLPETFRIQVDTALSPMLAALNLSAVFTLLALISIFSIPLNHQWLWCGLIFVLGISLARVLYFAVVNQAIVYGKLVRVAFDLYRHEVLKQMRIPIPDNLFKERILWDILNKWHYYYVAPWNAVSAITVPQPENPFYYDMSQTITPLAQLQELILATKDLPSLPPKNGKTKKVVK